jgi:hypothetical protein
LAVRPSRAKRFYHSSLITHHPLPITVRMAATK